MSPRSVLIIDESAETREVLRTALERRGNRILEASEVDSGLQLAGRHRPDVIVVDMEIDSADTVAQGLDEAGHQTSIVALATFRHQLGSLPTSQFVAKPYHFAPLIHKIEKLLGAAEKAPNCPGGRLGGLTG